MKKFFTSIVIALCAMSVNAQETIAIDADATYTAAQKLESANCSVVLCATGETMKVAAGALGDYTAYISGNNNPKDADGKGYSVDGKNLPTTGTYYVVNANQSGKVSFAMVLNAAKSFFVIAEDGTAFDDSNLSLVDKNGAAITLGTNNDSKENPIAHSTAEKFYGTVEFSVEANKNYYVLCTGSKLGFYGLTFTAGPTAIANVSADKANADAPVYNLNGQKVSKDYKGVVVKNGKKYVQK